MPHGNREIRTDVAAKHLVRVVHVDLAASGCGVLKHLDCSIGINAGLARHGKSFGGKYHADHRHVIVGDLHADAAALGAKMDVFVGQRGEHGLRLGKILGSAARHDQQRPISGLLGGATDRGIENAQPSGGQGVMQFKADLGRNRAHLNHQRAGGGRVRDASAA